MCGTAEAVGATGFKNNGGGTSPRALAFCRAPKLDKAYKRDSEQEAYKRDFEQEPEAISLSKEKLCEGEQEDSGMLE